MLETVEWASETRALFSGLHLADPALHFYMPSSSSQPYTKLHLRIGPSVTHAFVRTGFLAAGSLGTLGASISKRAWLLIGCRACGMQSWSAACGAQVSPVTATCIYDMVQLLAMFLGPLFSFYGLVDHYNEASSFLLLFFFFFFYECGCGYWQYSSTAFRF